MSKRRPNQGKHSQKQKAYMVYFPSVGLVQLAPSRESNTPFCAYYGPHGETCSSTTGLETVCTLASTPPVQYMACPLHYDAVYQTVQTFLNNLKLLNKNIMQPR